MQKELISSFSKLYLNSIVIIDIRMIWVLLVTEIDVKMLFYEY